MAPLRVPSRFVDFCEWNKIALTPAQRAFGSVAYDGEWPIDNEEQRLAEIIFRGRIDAAIRAVVVGAFGARGGKSYALISMRLLHLAMTLNLDVLAPGERAYGPVVGPKLHHACHVIGYVRGAILSNPGLAPLIDEDKADEIGICRPDGKSVSIKAFAASKGGDAVRGKSFIGGAMDEAAFFEDASYAVNDEDIFKAIAPRIIPGGQTLIYSTPWLEQGLFWNFFRAGTTEHVLVGTAPTLLMHDTPEKRSMVERENARDPVNAAREYGAQFISANTGAFFDGNAISAAVKDYELGSARNIRFRYAVGVDFGFKSDSSACVVAEWNGEKYRCVEAIELRPTPDHPLVPSEVVREFAAIAKRYGVRSVITDGHYREAIAEHLREHELGIIDAPAGAIGKLETHARARAVLHEGKCELPRSADRMLSQLRSIVSRPTSGGGMSILSPRKAGGGHGDLASAWVLAVHRLATSRIDPEEVNVPAYGTPEYEMFLAEKSIAKQLEADDKKYQRKGRKW